ncbi:MAG: heavy metal translocating P-type ATPase [Pyrinomonadaceae bacterium]|nr:heavy metal translocating P-type ATPase [Pyrinomonadaceae bacterium]MBP6213063.1 heavy metal translocating P-type ATPase [Pyrinomonadaceae bacterium]
MTRSGSAASKCDLCGLGVGKNPFAQSYGGDEKQFCCLGCMNVYTILTESGVVASGQDLRDSEIFKQSLALGLISNPDAIEPQIEIPSDAPTKETLLHVSGMWCSACSWLIEHTLRKEPGVVSAEAFFASDLVKIKYCPQYLPPERITKRISQLGYTASEFDPDNERSAAEKRDLVLRIGVAGFLWLNIMTLSVPLYVGYFQEISPSVSFLFPFILMALAAPVIFYSARPILHLAWTGLLNKTIRMETLLATGILAAFFHSSIQAFRGQTVVYFDTAAAIVTLVLLGKLMEKGAKERTTRAISMLYRLMPKKVRLFVDNTERFVAIDALNEGDIFVVKAGERIPADGIIVEGSSHSDESLLTGESTPIAKEPGSGVVSGSLNITNVIHVRATRVGGDTTLSQIIGLVENAIGSRSNIERTVDAVSRMFVPAVIVVAVIVFAVCYGFGFTPFDEAMMRAITILVIACPCALGLATPLAITAAVGAASRNGILVSDSSVLEKIRDLDVVVFDKTGTVTEGRFEFVGVAMSDETELANTAVAGAGETIGNSPGDSSFGDKIFERMFLPLIASLEKYSEHPIGSGLVRYAESLDLQLSAAKNIEINKGLGIAGDVDGKHVFIGNHRLVAARKLSVDDFVTARAAEWEAGGNTLAYFGIDDEIKGVLAFGDSIKPEAAAIIGQLKQRGIKTVVLSGDSAATTQFVAERIGADDFHAGALPSDKTDVIAGLQDQGLRVAMIGDGINDAPALAQADLGIAMGSGTDIAMKAADIVLVGNSLQKLLTVFDLSKKTWRIVRQNLFWAFFYNTLGMTLAVTGVLNPIMAAGAMLASSLSVIGNSMRLGSREK